MPQKSFLVLPTERTVALSKFHTITQTQVMLDPADSHYLSGSGNDTVLMLSKTQIEQLMAAANVNIVQSELVYDESARICWKVGGEIVMPNGDVRKIIKSYELDLRYKERDGEDGTVIRVLLANRRSDVDRARKEKKRRKWWMPQSLEPSEELEEAIRSGALRELEMMDRHRVARAETGATLRMARSALTIKSGYRKTDLETMPFTVYRATFDLGRVLRMGGEAKEMAMKLVSAALGQQMGIDMSKPGIAALLTPGNGGPEEEEPDIALEQLTEEQVDNLATAMVERGLNRAKADEWSSEVFGTALSGLTTDHIPLIEEYLELVDRIKEINLKGEDRTTVINHMRDLINFAYAQGRTIKDMMEQDIYNILYPPDDGEEEVVDAEPENGGTEPAEDNEQEPEENNEGEEEPE